MIEICETSPYTKRSSPYGGKTSPYTKRSSPYSGKTSPYTKRSSPYSGEKFCPVMLQENEYPTLLEDDIMIGL